MRTEEVLEKVPVARTPSDLIEADVQPNHGDERLGILVGEHSALEVQLVVELFYGFGSRETGFVSQVADPSVLGLGLGGRLVGTCECRQKRDNNNQGLGSNGGNGHSRGLL